jgi:Mg/Co/Ni transporter MgtE
VVKEVPVEVIKEVIREVVKEVPVEVIKEVIKEVPVEVIREVVREVPVEVIKQVEVVREVPKEVIKETIREVPKETIHEIVKLIPDAHGPVLLLSLLQQDGRLVDFLFEDIENYDDDQIGAAVREIHSKCRKALNKYLTIESVRPEKEGDVVPISAGFDPSAIRITGKVSDKVPMFGTLRHRGWRATRVALPPRPTGADPNVIMAAEVEVE